jgi:polysaccharide export outer membrane protein
METVNKLKIFLVDDDQYCRGIYRQYLTNKGYAHLLEFANGPDCLDNLYQQPDVIFLDHGMDHLTGLEVLRKIRIVNPNTYVVFLSGEANISTAVKALKLGAIEYIVKGINELANMTKVLDKIGQLKVNGSIKGALASTK